MQSGEDYLDSGRSAEDGNVRRRSKKKPGKKKAKKAKKRAGQRNEKESSTKEKKSKKSGRRSEGPGANLKQLLQDGFFDSPKTIAAVAVYLKDTYGVSFKINELSTPLLRFLRSKELTREKNSAEQYEYKRR
jgi:hypothetical protein